jgi:hypothetical protein
MKIINTVVFSLIFILIYGQDFSKVLGVPDKFNRPVDLSNTEMESYVQGDSGPKSKNRPWRVICDRSGYETYSDASGNAKSGKKLEFKMWYFVAEEKGNYIHLIKMNGEPDNSLNISKGSFVESYGWVEKSKMLLWTSGLRSHISGIYLKSLILYTIEGAQEVLKNNNQGVQFYSSPTTKSTPLGSFALYEFYFILKKENDMYLLGAESEMKTSAFYKKEILGWVHQNSQADWNTRLCVEQNFEKEAFDERKISPSKQFVAYSINTEAKNQAISGSGSTKHILTKDDPVNANKTIIAKSNNKRFIGTKLRMPVLKCDENTLSTGILGSMGTDNSNRSCPACQAVYDEISEFSNNYNILFLVEATTPMRSYKDELKSALGNLKRELTDVPNAKFAVAFYRNANINGKSFLDYTEMNGDIDMVGKKIDAAVFTEDGYDGYSSLYSALNKSVAKVGFKSNSTNVIFIIGQNPDFRENATLKLNCIDNNCDALIKTDKLVDQLSNIRAHLVFIQPSLPKNSVSNDLLEQGIDLMLEVSKSNFQSYKKVNDIMPTPKDVNPIIIEETSISYINGGSTKNVFYTSKEGHTISVSDFANNIRSTFKDIKIKQNNVAKALEDLINNPNTDPDEIKSSGFEIGALRDKLSEVLTRAGLEPNEENIKLITDRKVNLYVRGYIPKRIYGANNDLCSPVLFFPEKELGEYLEDLRTLVTLTNEPEDILRTRLKTTMISLYKKYSGESKVSDDITINDFVGSLTSECFKFDNPNHQFALNKINKPSVKIEVLRNFLEALEKKYRNLEAVSKSNAYEFQFKRSSASLGKNTYYWIPFEDTF